MYGVVSRSGIYINRLKKTATKTRTDYWVKKLFFPVVSLPSREMIIYITFVFLQLSLLSN